MATSLPHGKYFEDLSVGMEAAYTRTVTEADIVAFAQVSGDINPVHLDEEFAGRTPFKKRIAHGMLTASYVSTVFGTLLPGPGAIFISQTLNFKAPVYIDDEVTATVRVAELISAKKRAMFACTVQVRGKTVLEGDAVIMVPSRELA